MEIVKLRAKVLLQVDLEGHSAWLGAALSKPGAVGERIALAKRLHISLKNYKFILVSWKGDGGIYAASEAANAGTFDFAVEASDAATAVFAKWRAEKSSRNILRLRVCVHYAPTVYVHADPGYWASDDLNVFMKFEREIGVSGTIAVTNAIFHHLSQETQIRFTAERPLSLGVLPGVALIRSVYYSRIEAEVQLNRTSKLGYFEWLNRSPQPICLANELVVGPRAALRATIGRAAILFSAPHPNSPLTIDLIKVDANAEPDLNHADIQEWERIQKGLVEDSRSAGKENGLKASVINVTRPLQDIPYARIEWRNETWSRSRGFHKLLEKTPDLWRRLASNAADIQENGLRFPGILCCHFILRTTTTPEDPPKILICQRQQKGAPHTYSEGSWSLSFEEQLIPGESVATCAKRGLAEELLGQEGYAEMPIHVLAAVLERNILNLALIVLVDVPLSFQDLIKHWMTANDKDEHRQIALLEINREVLREIGRADDIPINVRGLIEPCDPVTFAATKNWTLHPTSLARASIALWVQEVGA